MDSWLGVTFPTQVPACRASPPPFCLRGANRKGDPSRLASGSVPIGGRCYSSVKKSSKPGENGLICNKENRLANCVTSAEREGNCPIIKDLNNPLKYNRNPQVVRSIRIAGSIQCLTGPRAYFVVYRHWGERIRTSSHYFRACRRVRLQRGG
jgi:hypothetical protein